MAIAGTRRRHSSAACIVQLISLLPRLVEQLKGFSQVTGIEKAVRVRDCTPRPKDFIPRPHPDFHRPTRPFKPLVVLHELPGDGLSSVAWELMQNDQGLEGSR